MLTRLFHTPMLTVLVGLLTLVSLSASAPVAANSDLKYVLGPDSPNQDVQLKWPNGDYLSVTLRVHDAKPSYIPNSVDLGTGASYQVSPWGSNPRTITFSHPDHTDDIVVEWSYDPTHVLDPVDPVSLPAPLPAFTPNPDANHTVGQPASHSYTGDHVQTLDPGIHAQTHVLFNNGTLTPPAGKKGINISNTNSSDYHAITIGSNAEINVTKAFATGIVTRNNEDNLRIINRGAINLSQAGRGLHAAMRDAPGNVRLVNYGTIALDGPTAEPEDVWTTKPHLVNAHILRAGAPHEFDGYSHFAELINMPDASLVATGTYNGYTSQWPNQMRNNGSMGGLKTEAGGGHLGRVINYGKIEIEATGARGLWAYGLWGAVQAHNSGTITMRGVSSAGIRVVNCAPYPFDSNGCHAALSEIVPDPDTTPGDVYARNYPTGVITILPSTRKDDTRVHRKAYGIFAYSKTTGRVFAINEGAVSTTGQNSHGIYARGYGNSRDQNDADFPDIPDYPDTSDHDAIYVANTGTITTTGEAAHGVHAKHSRGGQITVLNLMTTTAGTQSQGTITAKGDNSAGIFVHAPVGSVPVSTCSTADNDFPDASCQRVAVVSSVKVVNTGDIIADGSGGSGIDVVSDGGEVDVDNSGDIIADDIGIDVISDGGDITIVHTGDITASQVGIRVQTSGQGMIRVQITGQLNAPTPYEVIGGVNNEIIEDD